VQPVQIQNVIQFAEARARADCRAPRARLDVHVVDLRHVHDECARGQAETRRAMSARTADDLQRPGVREREAMTDVERDLAEGDERRLS
jgi:hypothetical protein